MKELDQKIDSRDLQGIGDLKDTPDSMLLCEERLGKINEFAWEDRTLKELIGSLLIPLIIWSIQLLFSRYFFH